MFGSLMQVYKVMRHNILIIFETCMKDEFLFTHVRVGFEASFFHWPLPYNNCFS